jgi:hypothetical protein
LFNVPETVWSSEFPTATLQVSARPSTASLEQSRVLLHGLRARHLTGCWNSGPSEAGWGRRVSGEQIQGSPERLQLDADVVASKRKVFTFCNIFPAGLDY